MSRGTAQEGHGELQELEGVMASVLGNPESFPSIAAIAQALGCNLTQTREVFQRHAQQTPERFLQRVQVDRVCSQMALAEPAQAPSFFEHYTGLSSADFQVMLESSTFMLPLPIGYRVGDLLTYQGRDAESVSERVEGTTLRKAFLLVGRPVEVQIRFGPGAVRVDLNPRLAPGPLAMVRVHRLARRLLGLDQDPAALESNPSHTRLVSGRRGLRIPLSLDPFEALVWAILGQQVNLAFAYALRRDLIRKCGVPVPGGLIAHPSPESIAILEPEDLLPLRLSRRKAEYLVLASRRVAEGSLNLEGFLTATSAEEALLTLRGIAPWTAAYTMMRGLGFPDCVPVGDAGLTLALKRFFHLDERPGAEETLELMAPFAPHRSLATYHLWTSLKGVPA